MSAYAVVNPATGEVVKEYPTISDATSSDAIARADKAHREWASSTTVAERAALIRKRRRAAHRAAPASSARSSCARWASRSSRRSARSSSAAAIYEYYADNAEELLADEPIELLGRRGLGDRAPQLLGVLLGIMPWNYPYYQVARFAGSEPGDRQHDPAQARAAVPRVGRGDGADLPRGGLPEGRLHQHLRDQRADRVA